MILSARMSRGSATRSRTCASKSFKNDIPPPPKARPSSADRTRSGSQATKVIATTRRLTRSSGGRARRVLRRSWYSGPPRTSENSSESSASGRSLMGPLNSSQRGFQRTWAYVAFQSPSPDRLDEGRSEAEGPVAHGDTGRAHTPTLQVPEHGRPALGALPVAILERDQFLRPVRPHADHHERAEAVEAPNRGEGDRVGEGGGWP